MNDKRSIEVSEESLDAIRFALRVAKADADAEYARAEYAYDKGRMSEAEKRADALDKALDELPSR